ncbi:phosphate ABC transporter substrate-binding protein PstS [Arcanobacterium buesumense]|uniref:Phosphate-binding protein n=1 Tax=Arcanobacterium buesumense TaxID=2722751 RepID=A0A6H2EM32_9ACTO|nr:phosphate ABC transporter substrate-binding protein PstS [Arcanobacterium buesumense]QJC22138.1 phosphate ABC transporter substrate-binding protein PstS [Arcanobacterium buesumense]
MTKKTGSQTVALLSVLALGLSACAGPAENTTEGSTSASSSSSLNGSGASSQVNAQQAWRDNFTTDSGIVVNYDPTGSGTGRKQFISGQVAYAGTDSILKADEVEKATQRCGAEPLELPLYISPIAVAFNLEGIDSLKLSAQVIAHIFDGKISSWNDDEIAQLNPGVKLPDLAVIPVNRADDSGTTENFQQYLSEAAGSEWSYEPSDTWPRTGTQSAEKTSGVVNLVKSTPGAITYADASQIGDLGAAEVEIAGQFLPYSPQAAAKIVDGSTPSADATERRLTVDLKRDGSIAGAYPIVMVSYLVACTDYDQAETAANVKSFLTYVASADGQEVAARSSGGNAPISDELRSKVMKAIELING